MAVAAKECLQMQTIAINCAIEDANYAVANGYSLRMMGKIKTELEVAWVNYEQAYECHQLIVTDEEACAAKQAKCLQRDSSDVALDELVALIEAKQKTGRAVQDNKDKVVDVAKPVQRMAKEFCVTQPQDKAEEITVKQALVKVVVDVKQLQLQDLQMDQDVVCLKQQEVRSSGGLDPGEDQAAAKVLVEVNSILGKEEEQRRMLKEVSDCGGLDPGEAVIKDEVEECGFKEKVEECGFKDKVEKGVAKDRVEEKEVVKQRQHEVKQEMNVEVKQDMDVEVSKDAQVWELLCEPLFNVKFVNICKTAFWVESLIRLSDYG